MLFWTHLTQVCCLRHCFFFPVMSSRKSVGDCCWQHGRSFESLGMWRRKPVNDRGLQKSCSFVNSSSDQSEYVVIFMDDAVPNRLQGVVGAASRCCSNRPKRQHSRQWRRGERRWLSKFLVRVPTDTQQHDKTPRFSSVSGLCPTRTRRRKRSASDTIAVPLVDRTHNDDAFVVVFKHRPIAHELFFTKTEQQFCRRHSHRTKPEPSGCPVRKTSKLKVLGAPTRETRLRVVSSESGGEQAPSSPVGISRKERNRRVLALNGNSAMGCTCSFCKWFGLPLLLGRGSCCFLVFQQAGALLHPWQETSVFNLLSEPMVVAVLFHHPPSALPRACGLKTAEHEGPLDIVSEVGPMLGGVSPNMPHIVNVPADGVCFNHCLVACGDLGAWMAQHDRRGQAASHEMRQRDEANGAGILGRYTRSVGHCLRQVHLFIFLLIVKLKFSCCLESHEGDLEAADRRT